MNDFGPKRPMSEDALCVPADTVKTKRGRPKKKPGYDRAEVIDDLLVKVVEFFGTPFDDREERPEDAPTIVSVANALQITPIKVRKMLITAGYYSTAMSRKVQALQDEGYSIQEIMEETGLGKASVNGYLPYTKGAYKLDSPTLYAEQGRLFRTRKSACESLREHLETENAEMYLWRNLLQSKREERDQSDGDESIPSGEADSSGKRFCQGAKGTGDFWRKLSLPSISSDWRVQEKP